MWNFLDMLRSASTNDSGELKTHETATQPEWKVCYLRLITMKNLYLTLADETLNYKLLIGNFSSFWLGECFLVQRCKKLELGFFCGQNSKFQFLAQFEPF